MPRLAAPGSPGHGTRRAIWVCNLSQSLSEPSTLGKLSPSPEWRSEGKELDSIAEHVIERGCSTACTAGEMEGKHGRRPDES